LNAVKFNISQLAERVDKLDEQFGDINALNGKLSDIKAMMKDIWKYQRRRAKKHHSSTTSPEKSSRVDTTKTDDDTFDDGLQTPDDDGDRAVEGGEQGGEND